MKDNLVNSIKSKCSSKLANHFFDTFNVDYLEDACRLAITLTKLGIQYDLNKLFDLSVSYDTLEQLQNTFNTIGQTSVDKQLKDIDVEVNEMQQMQCWLQNLILKKKNNILLSKSDLSVKQKSYEDLKEQYNLLNQKLQDIQEPRFEKKIYIKENDRNQRLQREIKELEKELAPCFDNISTNEDLDDRIAEFQSKLNKQLAFDKFDSSCTSPSTSLSFSFDT